MFEGFRQEDIQVSPEMTIRAMVGGQGQPLLLLHGHPETWLMWHKIADRLAERYTVVATDLRGYGDSAKPQGLPDHSNYSQRAMAEDQLAVMTRLGFPRFALMGHDRGARAAYRLALDHPEAVDKLILVDIVSTLDMFENGDPEFCRALFHWFFLAQDPPFPERMIEANLDYYFRYCLHIDRYHSENDTPSDTFPEPVYQEYLRCYRAPGTIHAICEDYRAGMGIDLADDRAALKAGRKILCPLLLEWGANGLVEKFFRPMAAWKRFADDIQGHALPCGHFVPEEAPEPLLAHVLEFLG